MQVEMLDPLMEKVCYIQTVMGCSWKIIIVSFKNLFN